MNTESGHVIHHPQEIPIEVQSLGAKASDCLSVRHTSLAELAFNYPRKINVGEVILLCIPSVNDGAKICGKVIWLAKSATAYVIGVSFYSASEAFRMRMLEQICHIEVYRNHLLTHEDRELSSEQAAVEWIASCAGAFPEVRPKAASGNPMPKTFYPPKRYVCRAFEQ